MATPSRRRGCATTKQGHGHCLTRTISTKTAGVGPVSLQTATKNDVERIRRAKQLLDSLPDGLPRSILFDPTRLGVQLDNGSDDESHLYGSVATTGCQDEQLTTATKSDSAASSSVSSSPYFRKFDFSLSAEILRENSAILTPVAPSRWHKLAESDARWTQLARVNSDINKLFDYECGGAGCCLFSSIAGGLNHIEQSAVICKEDIRSVAAEQLNVKNIQGFMASSSNRLSTYVRGCASLQQQVATIKAIIKRPGWTYQGETDTLAWLLLDAPFFERNQIGFLIVHLATRKTGEPILQCAVVQNEHTEYLLCLHNLGNAHWRLLGVSKPARAEGTITLSCLFHRLALPPVLYDSLAIN